MVLDPHSEETRQLILLMVLARLQAEGKTLSDVDQVEIDMLIDEAVADLVLGGVLPEPPNPKP